MSVELWGCLYLVVACVCLCVCVYCCVDIFCISHGSCVCRYTSNDICVFMIIITIIYLCIHSHARSEFIIQCLFWFTETNQAQSEVCHMVKRLYRQFCSEGDCQSFSRSGGSTLSTRCTQPTCLSCGLSHTGQLNLIRSTPWLPGVWPLVS